MGAGRPLAGSYVVGVGEAVVVVGFLGVGVCRFCLQQFCGDGGVEEVEGSTLQFGGFGEFVDGDVGVTEDDLVAGEGGEMIEECLEAVGGVAVGGGAGGGLLLGLGGAVGFRYGVGSAVGWLFVGEAQWCPCLAKMPYEVGGEHADEHVGADSLLEAVVDGS